MKSRTLAFAVSLAVASAGHAATCPGQHWELAPPAISAWSSDKLAELERLLRSLDTTALVVVHRGRIVFEYGRVGTPMNLHSARKSMLSILYGIAVARGQAKLEATIRDLGIDDSQGLTDVEKTATVKDLLAARSCVYHEAEYETAAMKAKRPARHSCKPGERWHYNNWDFNALGTAYRIQTGKTVFEGFEDELARPLGFEDFDRASDTRFVGGTVSRHPAYVIELSARDLARVGLLMSRDGNWCGKAIVAPSWVAASTTTISATDRGASVGYGYLWWTSPDDTQFAYRFHDKVFSARGHLGQYLLVEPAADLVIAHLTDGNARLKRQVSSRDFGRIVKAIMAALPRGPRRGDD